MTAVIETRARRAREPSAVSTLLALAGLDANAGGDASRARLYVGTLAVGFAILVALFKAGALGVLSVMFFRGLVLAGIAFLAAFGLAWAALWRWKALGLTGRDAFSAAVLSLSFNTCFLVVVPVTVDRSISIFMLGEMNAAPEHLYSAEEMSQLFKTVYVGHYRQIERRMREQTVAGNVEAVDERYRISSRGKLSVATAKLVVWLFGGDERLANPAAAKRAVAVQQN